MKTTYIPCFKVKCMHSCIYILVSVLAVPQVHMELRNEGGGAGELRE